jgi:hypothetical protein
MSLGGTSENEVGSLPLHPIIQALNKENFDAAITLLKEFKKREVDTTQVAADKKVDPDKEIDGILIELAKFAIPALWFAAFSNPILKEAVCYRHLKPLLDLLNTKGSLLPPSADFHTECDELMLVVARNKLWCQIIGYYTFVPLTKNHPKLTAYIVENPDFLRYLEPNFLFKLLLAIPTQMKPILRSIFRKYDDKPLDKAWVIEAIKYLMVKGRNVREMIDSDLELADVKAVIAQEKEKDSFFSDLLKSVSAQDQESKLVVPRPTRIPQQSDLQRLMATVNADADDDDLDYSDQSDNPVIRYLSARAAGMRIDDDNDDSFDLAPPRDDFRIDGEIVLDANNRTDSDNAPQYGLRKSRTFYHK